MALCHRAGCSVKPCSAALLSPSPEIKNIAAKAPIDLGQKISAILEWYFYDETKGSLLMPVGELATGVDIYHEVHGDGEAVFFIPATGLAGNVWDETQVEPLSELFKVVVHDPRGCGRSSKPTGVYTIDQMGCDVIALMDHLSIKSAHIVGHSMGGRIALSIALNFPRRVKSLMLAASGSGPASRDREDCVPGIPFYLMKGIVDLGFNAFLKHEICETDSYFPDRVRALRPELVDKFYQTVIAQHAKYPEYLRLCMARHMWEATHRLGDVVNPTLVVVGNDDSNGSNHLKQSKILTDRIQGARLVLLPGESHGFFWQAPKATNQLITDWITRNSKQPPN